MKDGKLAVVCGASRSGKSLWVKRQIKKSRRVIVWDDKGEYAGPGWIKTHTDDDLIFVIEKVRTGRARIAHNVNPGSKDQFNEWARLAFIWGKLSPCVVVAEELAGVTSPGKAPHQWGSLVRKILGYGCDVYAITQRPAESDKTIMGNNTFIHCGRLAREKDRKYMAEEMDIPVEKISRLLPLQWIEKHADGKILEGKIKL